MESSEPPIIFLASDTLAILNPSHSVTQQRANTTLFIMLLFLALDQLSATDAANSSQATIYNNDVFFNLLMSMKLVATKYPDCHM